jgi:choline kinase
MHSPRSYPRALILAAGLGRRIGLDHPKALLEFAGRSLLERHLRLLQACGVRRATLALGHQGERLREAAQRAGNGLALEFVDNPRYREGSIVTLWTLRHALAAGESVLVMDADVLYDQRMLQRLLASPHENVFLLDRDFEPGEEPVKLCVRGARLVEFRKRVSGTFDYCGESVGFFRFGPGKAAELARRAEDYVQRGHTEAPHEEAIRDLLLADPEAFGWEDVTGLPWMEIDFPQDVRRARERILPALLPLP